MARDVLLVGKVFYPKFFKPVSFQNGPLRYETVFYPDKDSMEIIKSLKLRNHIKSDANGDFIRLRRDHDPKIHDGKVITGAEGGPPKVVDASGKPWDQSVYIGNGSRVSLVLNVYDTRMGPGSRISRVRVDELVAYNPDQPVAATGAMPF